MIKPGALADMPPESRTQLFEALAVAFYGPKATYERVAEGMGYNGRSTVYHWIKTHNVPLPVIYTLDAWVNGLPIVDGWTRATAQLSRADLFTALAAMPGADGDAGAS